MRKSKNSSFPGVQVAGEGEPLVLLHSSMSSGKQWAKLLEAMSRNRQVINIDLLGYGNAPKPDRQRPFSLAEETGRIESILAELDVSGFDLIGHSYGGATALKLAYENAQQVNRLVLFEPVAFHLLVADNPGRQEVVELGEAMAAMSDFEAAESFLDYWNGNGYFANIPDFVQQQLLTQVYKGVMDFEALLGESYQLQHYRDITQPTLLLSGRETRHSALAVIQSLDEYLPNSVIKITSGGHMAPISHSKEVNQYIIDFLS